MWQALGLMVSCALLAAGVAEAWAASAGGLAPLAYTAGRLAGEPELDGLIRDDPAWAPAAESSEAFQLLGRDQKSSRTTRFRIGYTAKGLCVAAVCDEPDMAKLSTAQDSMGKLWEDDSLELFLEPRPGEGTLHLIVNAIGSRYNDSYRGSDGLLNWAASAFLEDKAWTVEVWVPFEVLGVLPVPGTSWRLNVCRTVRTVGPAQYSSWAPCASQFAEPRRFGVLSFGGPGLSEAERKAAEARLTGGVANRPGGSAGERFAVVRPDVGLQFLQPGKGEDMTLVRLNGVYVAPRLAPDGTRVFYQSRRGGTMGVWSVSVTEKKEERICDGEQVSVSADGTRILLVRGPLVVERELGPGRERTVLRAGKGETLAFPSYLPDGRLLYVVSQRRVCVVPANGGEPVALAEGEVLSAPRASPDGRWVAWPDGAHISLVEVATRLSRRLTLGGGLQAWPLWARDSKSICFCQADAADSTVFDIYRVGLDRPDTWELVVTKAMAAPDWSGGAPKVLRKSLVEDGPLRVLTTVPPRPLDDALLADASLGWGPPSEAAKKLAGGCVVDSPWLCLVFSVPRNRIELSVKASGHLTPIAELTVEDAAGRPAAGLLTVGWRSRSAERVEIEAELKAQDGKRVRAGFSVARGRPLVTVSPGRNAGGVRVLAALAQVSVLDQFGDDLLLDPAGTPAAESRLPRAPLLFGFPAGEPARLLLLIPTHDKQSVMVWRDAQAATFGGLRVRLAGAPMHVAGLADADLRPRLSWRQKAGSDDWQAPWPNPGLARWRVVLRAGERPHSTTLDLAAPQDTVTIPLAAGLVPTPAGCAVFRFERNALTEPAVLTPMDLFQDALGVAAAAERQDRRGLRECRGAEVDCPFKDYRGPARIATWIEPHEPGAAQSQVHFTEDVANLLAGLESRAAEYLAFFARVETQVPDTAAKAPDLQAAWERLREPARAAKAVAPPTKPLTEFTAVLEKIRSAGPGATQARDKLVKDMAALAEQLATERIRILVQYRDLAREIRNRAGLLIVAQPHPASVIDEVRDAAGVVLRRRYYHEADWRGETPLNPEEVDYEKLKKL